MIRPVLTEFGLFILPFALYAAFLVATRAKVLEPQAWSWSIIAWLTRAALVLVLGSFVVMAQFGGAPPRSTYTPAHIERGGSLVPGGSQ